MVDVIPAKGGMGPGGISETPTARMGRGTISSREKLDQINKDYAETINARRGINPPETKTAEPLTKEQMRARSKANAEVQKQLPRMPKQSKSYTMEEGPEELNFKKGGKVSSASSRGDGCAQRGKTKGRFV